MITLPNIGILMPGDMGHACAKVLIDNNFKVFTCLKDRSKRTLKLAEKSGIKNIENYPDFLKNVDLVLSILPPEFALSHAKKINNELVKNNINKMITYVDCNAISPETAKKIDKSLSAKYFKFVDGGIIGLNPIIENGNTILYLSGKYASELNILNGKGLKIKIIGNEIGKASAMKMVYASATKGTFALHAAVITAARKLNLYDDYVEELKYSKPNILEAMTNMVPKIPLDAKRWTEEMREISRTYKNINLTPKFHEGATDIMKLADKTPIAKETRENFNTSRSLLNVVEMFVKSSEK